MKWNESSYQRIKRIEVLSDILRIEFWNGDTRDVNKKAIHDDIDTVSWNNLTFTDYELLIPSVEELIEIPWDTIRVITDNDFAKYIVEVNEQNSILIGYKLKNIRERKKISSKDLAERTGLTPQTISRIENGHTDVSFSTLRKILVSMGNDLSDLSFDDIENPISLSEISLKDIETKLSNIGINPDLLYSKIIPEELYSQIKKLKQPYLLLKEAASYITKIFNIKLEDLLSDKELTFKNNSNLVYYKKPKNLNEKSLNAYTRYAYYITEIISNLIKERNTLSMPENIDQLKIQFYSEYNALTLENLLDYSSRIGIHVIPLKDAGNFHGACWYVNDKKFIILKQASKSHARWIFDLLHELYHALAHLDKDEADISIIETETPVMSSYSNLPEEKEANNFANSLIFKQETNVLVAECENISNGDIRKLSKAVSSVAKKYNEKEDFLANYIATRLTSQNINFWGSAHKFQITDPDPFEITRNYLQEKLNLSNINHTDYIILSRVLNF